MVVEKIFNTQPLFNNFVFIFTWKKAIKNLCNMYQYRKFLTSQVLPAFALLNRLQETC